MKNILVKIKSETKTIEEYQVKDGQLLTLTVQKGVNYELFNTLTQAGPQNIIAYRDGQDLFIILDENEGNGSPYEIEPDIKIINYYGEQAGEAGETNATGIFSGIT